MKRTKDSRHRYALLMRPPGPGALPGRGIKETKGEHFKAPSGHFAWGWAEYDRELTDEEIADYELEEMGNDDHAISGIGSENDKQKVVQ